MTGWYLCVKEALLERGWYLNSDPNSPFSDLKWTLRSVDINQETLQPWQLTNHFMKNVAITTKAGLIKSLRSLVWFADAAMHDIIPRAYDLSNAPEMHVFIDDFRSEHDDVLLLGHDDDDEDDDARADVSRRCGYCEWCIRRPLDSALLRMTSS